MCLSCLTYIEFTSWKLRRKILRLTQSLYAFHSRNYFHYIFPSFSPHISHQIILWLSSWNGTLRSNMVHGSLYIHQLRPTMSYVEGTMYMNECRLSLFKHTFHQLAGLYCRNLKRVIGVRFNHDDVHYTQLPTFQVLS